LREKTVVRRLRRVRGDFKLAHQLVIRKVFERLASPNNHSELGREKNRLVVVRQIHFSQGAFDVALVDQRHALGWRGRRRGPRRHLVDNQPLRARDEFGLNFQS
jgi:hypothetical protein